MDEPASEPIRGRRARAERMSQEGPAGAAGGVAGGTAGTGPSYVDRATERFLLVISVSVITAVAFEAVAVGTAMPTVASRLHGLNLYAVAMGIPLAAQLVTTAFAGLWCDAKSPQSCLHLGIGVLSAGLVVCTAAPNMPVFVVGRAVQGLGAGMCVVPLYAMVGSSVRTERQSPIFASLSAAWIVPSLVGPGIAGFLVEHASWRLVFGAVPALLAAAFPVVVAGTRRIPRTHGPRPLTGTGRILLPAAGAGAAVATLQILSGADSGGLTAWVYAAAGAAAAATFACVRPLLPPGTFALRCGLASTVLVRGLVSGVFIGIEAFLPLLLKEVHGWSPTPAGLILTVGSVTWALGSWIHGRVVSPRLTRRLPAFAVACQFAGVALVAPGSFAAVPAGFVVAGWTLAGLGIGLVFPAMSVLALAMTPRDRHGATSSAIQLADTLGAAFCVAVAGLVYAAILPSRQAAFAVAIGALALILGAALVAVRRIRPIPGSAEEAELAARTHDPVAVLRGGSGACQKRGLRRPENHGAPRRPLTPASHHGWCETSRTVRVPFRRRTTRLCEARGRPS